MSRTNAISWKQRVDVLKASKKSWQDILCDEDERPKRREEARTQIRNINWQLECLTGEKQ